jgi:hypothetical protein
VNVVAPSRVTEVEEAVSATLLRVRPGAPRLTTCPIELRNPNETKE